MSMIKLAVLLSVKILIISFTIMSNDHLLLLMKYAVEFKVTVSHKDACQYEVY